jgi:hypothetical protein
VTLTTVHPLWLLPFCLALGLLGAWLLYRSGSGPEGWSMGMRRGLGAVRALVIAALAFLLLEPMVRMFVREVRKPVIVVAHDGSASLTYAGDTAFVRKQLPEQLQGLSSALAESYEVRTLTYAEAVTDGLDHAQTGGLTDMDALFRTIQDRYAGPDLGAVILDGDGIYNRGRDPRLSAERLGVPIYTIALGDTLVRPDLAVRNVEANSIAYLGNEFPLLARVQAHHFRGRSVNITVKHDGRELATARLEVSTDPQVAEVPLMVKAERPGLQRYVVSVTELEGEATTLNNVQVVHVDVLDDRRKVLILAQAPHPDVAAIRQSLQKLDGYACEAVLASDFSGDVADYDLVVLHQLPAMGAPIQPVIKRMLEKQVPSWTIIGQSTDFNQLAAVAPMLAVSGAQRVTNDAQAAAQEEFTLFTTVDGTGRAWERFPPLQVPIATYTAERGAAVLLRQRIGVVRTEYPLMAFDARAERHSAVTCGEGLWRWRLADQQLNRTQANFDELVQKTVAYLAVEKDRSRFRVHHPRRVGEREAVTFDAELYNASYEPVNTPETGITLRNEAGEDLAYTFSRVGTGYRLDAGILPPGRYTWRATTKLDAEPLSATGELLVEPLVAERLSTVADHALMATLAARSQGSMVGPDGIAGLAQAIQEKGTIVPRSYGHARFTDIIGLRWIFGLLLVLLTVEWAVRRRSGSY